MPLYWFLLVISVLASDATAAREVPVLRALLASAGFMTGWGILAYLAARNAARQVLGGEVSYLPAAHALSRQMDILRWLGLAMSTWVLVGFGVAGIVAQVPWIASSMALKSTLLLLPALMATVWSWHCEFDFDSRIHPPQRKESQWLPHLLATFRLQAAWLLAPVLVLLILIDLTHGLLHVTAGQGALIAGAIAILLLPLLLPQVLRRVWKLHPITPPEKGAWCQSVLDAAGVRGIRVLQWDTGGMLCTALVAGFLPRFRCLLVTDALLARLTPQQTAMVLLHELSHLRRWHLPLRMLVLLPIWGIASAVSQWLGEYSYADLGGILVGLGLSLVALRLVAYRTEYDADQTAVKLAVAIAPRVLGVPATAHDAALALADALHEVTVDQPAAQQATWLHPSIQDRRRRLLGIAPAPSAPPLDPHLPRSSLLQFHPRARQDPGTVDFLSTIAPGASFYREHPRNSAER